jgi:hypothetical protein
MSAHELLLAFAYLETTLGNDSTLAGYAPGGVSRDEALPNIATPYVITAHQAGSDSTTMNGFRVITRLLMQVKAVGPSKNTGGLASASARIDVLLGGPPGLPPGGIPIVIGGQNVGWLYSVYRDSPLVTGELVAGEKWSNVGGLYRMEVGQIY